jgi:hypothetical protein
MKNSVLRGAFVAALAAALSSLPGPAFAGDLKLTMQNGRVTIIADNVPLRQILQEWARVGKTTIVNADKMNGPAISIQLVDAPERDALDILLRSASGYIAAPRPVPVANAAFYDRVTIMATSRAPAATAGNMPPPTFQRPPTPNDDSDEPINVTMPQGFPGNGQYPMNGVNGPNGPNGQFPGMPPQNIMPNPMQPGMQPPMQPQGPIMSTKPGAVPQPQPQFPNGIQNPYQPLVRPGGVLVSPNGRGGGAGGL